LSRASCEYLIGKETTAVGRLAGSASVSRRRVWVHMTCAGSQAFFEKLDQMDLVEVQQVVQVVQFG
jgi:hypothetical protein